MKKIIKLCIFLICVLSFVEVYYKFNYKDDKPIIDLKVFKSKDKSINCLVISAESNLMECQNNIIYEIDSTDLNTGDIIKLSYDSDNFDGNYLSLTKEEVDYEKILDEGIFRKYYDDAIKMVEDMSLAQKIGQLLLVRVPESNQIDTLNKYHFGGYLLFKRDFNNKSKEDIINNINDYQKSSEIPLLIATDEEGGTVSRISGNTSITKDGFSSPRSLYEKGGMDLVKEDNIKKNTLLDDLGINLNLAPVLDLSSNKSDYIYERSISGDVNVVSSFAKTIISSSKSSNVSNCLKHFPGYANNSDTHKETSIDNRSVDDINNDLIPFKSGIDEKAESVMINHNIINNIDSNYPASLSYKVHNLLRDNLSFTGIIITDDLSMAAIKDNYDSSAIINAVNYGNDMLIVTNYDLAYKTIFDATKSNDISEKLIDKKVIRILAWKYYKGLL